MSEGVKHTTTGSTMVSTTTKESSSVKGTTDVDEESSSVKGTTDLDEDEGVTSVDGDDVKPTTFIIGINLTE